MLKKASISEEGAGLIFDSVPAKAARRNRVIPFDFSKVSVIIPALNEASSLPLVLNDLPDVGEVIVVDNGSTDQTSTIASEAGATVIYEPRRGYGAACLRGLDAVRQSIKSGQNTPKIIVFLDADYGDHPHLLPELVKPIMKNQADFVLGSRFLGDREPGAMPPQRVYGNKLACYLMRTLFGSFYTDLCPLRAINYQSLLDLKMIDKNFGWTLEMQIKASRAKLRSIEIPVPYQCRIESSKISGTITSTLKAGSKILYTIGKYGLRR